MPWEAPAPRLRELVEALRHIWGAFQGEHPLRFRGKYYRHDLMTPFFDPGPHEWPAPPIYLAAVTPTMYRLPARSPTASTCTCSTRRTTSVRWRCRRSGRAAPT